MNGHADYDDVLVTFMAILIFEEISHALPQQYTVRNFYDAYHV